MSGKLPLSVDRLCELGHWPVENPTARTDKTINLVKSSIFRQSKAH